MGIIDTYNINDGIITPITKRIPEIDNEDYPNITFYAIRNTYNLISKNSPDSVLILTADNKYIVFLYKNITTSLPSSSSQSATSSDDNKNVLLAIYTIINYNVRFNTMITSSDIASTAEKAVEIIMTPPDYAKSDTTYMNETKNLISTDPEFMIKGLTSVIKLLNKNNPDSLNINILNLSLDIEKIQVNKISLPDTHCFNFVGTPPNEFIRYKCKSAPSNTSESPLKTSESPLQPSESPSKTSETSYTLIIGIILGVIVLIGGGYIIYNHMNYRHMKHNNMSHNMHKLRGSSNLNYDFNNVKVRDGYYYYNI
jgi:hypothetical protein